ncbi:CoA transferase [Yinghuangia sp. ASG 101]|uniref:CoA transferase n=1 Tax=Yinghuangia sp. ASG 101 TaxID=2896848 RepID=UPI001E2AEB34|nr:CoA transferase [Yinghuangia sp. ASG 101]UGQ12092.1 CoA transferase [Yinghuangia sp. ASG 101]
MGVEELTGRIQASIADPLTHDGGFDPHQALREVLASAGLCAADSGGSITFIGSDPIVPSVMRLGAVSALGLAAKSVAVAALWRHRGGEGQDITVDLRKTPHRLCPFYDGKWELLNGYPGGMPADPENPLGFGFYRTRDERWVMPLNSYPKLRTAAFRLLRTWPETQAVADSVARWNAADLERAGDEAGVVMPMLRTTEEFVAEDACLSIAREPLIRIENIGDSAPEPLPAAVAQPLSGLRALGMGHVVAGAGVGRDLAYHGADVLNIWRPYELEHDASYNTANVGVRSATIDPYGTEGRARVRELLRDADVFYANRRPGYLEKVGLTAEEAAAIRPGIVHLSLTLAGETGPWAHRVGFDQTAGALTGILLMEGTDGIAAGPTSPPGLPPTIVVNDYVTSWLATTGILAALMRRATHGGSYRVTLNLTRVAAWILSLGVFDRAYALDTALNPAPASPHAYLDPDTFSGDTPCGHYHGVTDQIVMSKTPGRFRDILLPRGSSTPVWLPRPN